MVKAKQRIKSLINQLPDDCTEEEIFYRLYMAQKIQRGLDDLKHERVKSQKAVEREFEKWLSEP